MVSVIVPVYKSEKTLKMCVNSLTAQTYEDIEIILVVDGPPDSSGVLAEELAKTDSRIRVINQENQGVSAARNRGIREAKGEYIRFLDSDDYVLPDSIACLMEAMKEKVDMVIAGYHHLYFGRRIGKKSNQTGEFTPKCDMNKMYDLYKSGFLNMPWNKLYRREKIVEGFPLDLNLGEDLLFNLEYLKNCDMVEVIEDSVCEYVQDDRGTTLSSKKRMDKIPISFRLYERTSDFFEELYGEEQLKGVLESKLVVEFLDHIESLAFDKESSSQEKKAVIVSYQEALGELMQRNEQTKIRLELLDYKIIYFFLKRNMTNITYFMIMLRGIVVKVLGKR